MLLWSAPCPEGTRIHQKPTASSEGAQLWDNRPLTLSWFRKAGPTIVLYILRDASVPLRGTHLDYHMYPQLRCFAACSGFHNIGPALRNQQLILEIMSVDAGLRRDAIASYVCSASSYIVVIRNFVPPRKSSKFLTLRRFCRHNICIPNAQYYEFSAQQNLWCEILEF